MVQFIFLSHIARESDDIFFLILKASHFEWRSFLSLGATDLRLIYIRCLRSFGSL